MGLVTQKLHNLRQWRRLNHATKAAQQPHKGLYNGEDRPVPGYPKWTALLNQERP